jgi:RNA polymerase sigma-70 factor (ECF subfamily)
VKIVDLYRAHSKRVERMIAHMLGSSSDASDLMQETFLRVYASELGDRTEVSQAILTVTARRLALNEIRNQTRRRTDLVGDFEALGVQALDDPEAQAEDNQVQMSLRRAIGQMPPQCRRVFELRTMGGLTHSEISLQLGISPKTVERHMTKAIRICRERMIADGHLAAGQATVGGRAL